MLYVRAFLKIIAIVEISFLPKFFETIFTVLSLYFVKNRELRLLLYYAPPK